MLHFTALLHRFGEQGEKTGWTFFEITEEQAQALNPGQRKIYRVKGLLDSLPIQSVAIFPVGLGDYILPVNAQMRRALNKEAGHYLEVALEVDTSTPPISADLKDCLEAEPGAKAFFDSLTPGHQRYFSNWVEDAKTLETKAKRLSQSVFGLAKGMDFGATIRYFKSLRNK